MPRPCPHSGSATAESDAVGLVVELFRVQLIEAVQLGVFQDLGVQRCHAVGGVGEVDVHVSHVYPVVLVDDGKALVFGTGAGQFIQLFGLYGFYRHTLLLC